MVHPASFLKIRKKSYVVNNLPSKTSVYFWDLVECKKVEKKAVYNRWENLAKKREEVKEN